MQPLCDMTVCEGEIAQMEVKFSQENIEGVWMKNGRPIEASNRVHIVIDKQLHRLLIEDTNKDDSGAYSFEVPAQEISTSAKLLIQSKKPMRTWHSTHGTGILIFLKPFSCVAAIGILIPLKDVGSVEGTKTVLETKISVQDISSIKWYHNHKLLASSERVQMVVKGAKQRLVFARTHASDEGHYKLVVGRAETSCQLSVQSKKDYGGTQQG